MLSHEVPDPDWYLDHVIVPSGIEHRPIGPARAWQGDWEALARALRESADDTPVGAATRLALRQGFTLTRAQVRNAGVPDAALRRMLRRGTWTSCGRASLAVLDASARAPGGPHELARRAHALGAAAAAWRRRGHAVAFTSAAVLYGLPVLVVPPLPELIADRPATTGRRSTAHVRQAGPRPVEFGEWFGTPVTGVAQTVLDLARLDPRAGLVAADAALREHLVDAEQLRQLVRHAAGVPGVRAAREVLELASPLIESPLESITRFALHRAGLPSPQLQAWLRGADGRRYRVDFYWPQLRLILEADGRGKYRDDALWAEKRRELALTRAGYRVVRVTWSDVQDGAPPWLVDALRR